MKKYLIFIFLFTWVALDAQYILNRRRSVSTGSPSGPWTYDFNAGSQGNSIDNEDEWTVVDGGIIFDNYPGDMGYDGVTSPGYNAAQYNQTLTADYYIEFDADRITTYFSPGCAWAIDGDDYYCIFVTEGTGYCRTIVNGAVDATLDTFTAYSEGDRVRIEFSPGSFTMYVNDVLHTSFGTSGTITNSTLNYYGYGGIFTWGAEANGDNFELGYQ